MTMVGYGLKSSLRPRRWAISITLGRVTSWAMRMNAQFTELAVADVTLMAPDESPSSLWAGFLSRSLSPGKAMAQGEDPSTESFGP